MQPYDLPSAYVAQTAQSDAVPETAIYRPSERSKSYKGVRGNNPTEQVLLVACIQQGMELTAAEIRAGKYTYRVEAGQGWEDAGANTVYCFATEGESGAVTHYVQEVI